MAYRLKLDQDIEASVSKIGREQLARAIKELTAASERPGVSAVHETRKCLKRARALVRLVKPGLAPAVFRKLDGELRDVGRSLAAARDAEILSATVGELRHTASGPETAALAAVEEHLAAAATRASGTGAAGDASVEAAIASLADMSQSFKKLELKPDGLSCVEQGLALGMKQARRSMAEAYTAGTSEAFHEWRKTVQRHWRHMQLLSRAWPAMFDARVGLARQLSQTLGLEHDLTILRHHIDALPNSVLAPGETDALQRLIVRRQNELRGAARHQGAILLSEKPKAFAHHIAAIWKAARQRAEASGGGNGAFDTSTAFTPGAPTTSSPASPPGQD